MDPIKSCPTRETYRNGGTFPRPLDKVTINVYVENMQFRMIRTLYLKEQTTLARVRAEIAEKNIPFIMKEHFISLP